MYLFCNVCDGFGIHYGSYSIVFVYFGLQSNNLFFFFTFQNETIKKVYVEYVGYDLTYAFKTGGTFPAIYDCYRSHCKTPTTTNILNFLLFV